MKETRLSPEASLQKIFSSFSSAVIAFSGGLDSSFLLCKAVEYLGKKNVAALTCANTHIYSYELTKAMEIANKLDILWQPILAELPDSFYENTPERCYICKDAILSKITHYANTNGYDAVLEGSVTDDHGEYRPGRKAIRKHKTLSPLLSSGVSKVYIRENIPNILKEFTFIDQSCIATRQTTKFNDSMLLETELAEKPLRDVYPDIRLKKFKDRYFIGFKTPAPIIKEKADKASEILERLTKR